MLRTSYSVLSTIAASAGDITQSQGYLSITGCPTIKYDQINNAGFGYTLKLAEFLGSITVTPTATVGVPSTLVITQYRGDLGKVVMEVVSYTPVSGDTATIVATAWRAQLALYKDLNVTGSGTSTFIVAANASSATTGLFGSAIINVTSTSGVNTVAPTVAAIAVTGATTATPIVVSTSTTTDVVAGQSVFLSGVGGMPEANGAFIVGTVVGSTSFGILNYYTGANTVGVGTYTSGGLHVQGTVGATTSTTNVSSGGQSRGAYWDLVAVGVDPSLLTIGKTYNQIIFQYKTNEGGDILTPSINQHTLYVQDDATNFAAFKTRIVEITNDYAASSTNADPANLSLI